MTHKKGCNTVPVHAWQESGENEGGILYLKLRTCWSGMTPVLISDIDVARNKFSSNQGRQELSATFEITSRDRTGASCF